MNKRLACVRIDLNRALSKAARSLYERLRLMTNPALIWVDGDANVLHVQYARLYPAYHFNGVERSEWAETLWSARDLLTVTDRIQARRAAEDARLAALVDDPAVPAAVERARILIRRAWPAQAAELLAGVQAQAASVEAGELLATLHASRDRPGKARAVYDALLAAHPQHARAASWRFASLTLHVREATLAAKLREPSARAALEALEQHATTTEHAKEAIEARLVLVAAAQVARDDAAMRAHIAWLDAQAGTAKKAPAPWSAAQLMQLAELELGLGADGREASQRHLWQIVHGFPDSLEAQRVKHGMLGGMLLAAVTR